MQTIFLQWATSDAGLGCKVGHAAETPASPHISCLQTQLPATAFPIPVLHAAVVSMALLSPQAAQATNCHVPALRNMPEQSVLLHQTSRYFEKPTRCL